MKIRRAGTELLHAVRQTEAKLIRALERFVANALKKGT
jgi:hypothetical protein